MRKEAEIYENKIEELECLTQRMVKESKAPGFLWKVKRDSLGGGQSHFYLLGTVHAALVSSAQWSVSSKDILDSKVLDAIEEVDEVFVECDLEKLSEEELMRFQHVTGCVEKLLSRAVGSEATFGELGQRHQPRR